MIEIDSLYAVKEHSPQRSRSPQRLLKKFFSVLFVVSVVKARKVNDGFRKGAKKISHE